MKCKQGDLAIVTGSSRPDSPNLGKIVTCLRLATTEDFKHPMAYPDKAYWVVDSDMLWWGIIEATETLATFTQPIMTDDHLTPLRGLTLEEFEAEEIEA